MTRHPNSRIGRHVRAASPARSRSAVAIPKEASKAVLESERGGGDPRSEGPGLIARNLRSARVSAGATQVATAQRSRLSREAYRKIESGQSIPRADTLEALAMALDTSVEALVSPTRSLTHVRFRSLRKLKGREDILSAIAKRISNIHELEELVGARPETNVLSSVSVPVQAKPEETAAEVRLALGLAANEAIRDICGLLSEKAGIKVLQVQRASDAFFGLSVGADDGGPAIVVNTWASIPVERWIFTAAHELGHLILHGSSYQVDRFDEEKSEEREANIFASHFLMPSELFQSEWRSGAGLELWDRILKLKRMFRVSFGAILFRLGEMYSQEREALWKWYRVEQKRRNGGLTPSKSAEPMPLPREAFDAVLVNAEPDAPGVTNPEQLSRSDFMEDRESWLVRKALLSERISRSRAAELLGIDLIQLKERLRQWRLFPAVEEEGTLGARA